ncbi:MAG: hypothetical protein ACTSU3_05305 [Candidatus Thorarchaeota archaeon]
MDYLRMGRLMVVLVMMTIVQPGVANYSQPDSFITSATDLTLIIDFGNNTILTFYNVEGDNAFQATNTTVEVQGDWYSGIVYVTSIM